MLNKKGFTLSELLVALGIVGVIGAITIPSIHKILPDKDKGMVLKAYQAINAANNEIFGSPSLYMFDSSCSRFILQCTDAPVDGQHSTPAGRYSGMNKYPALLIDNLTLADSNVNITNGKCTFNTSDGSTWSLEPRIQSGKPEWYVIEINTNNSNRANCSYSSSCKNPGKFRFAVDKYGITRAWDALTDAYIQHPSDLSDRRADLQYAATLSATQNYTSIPD